MRRLPLQRRQPVEPGCVRREKPGCERCASGQGEVRRRRLARSRRPTQNLPCQRKNDRDIRAHQEPREPAQVHPRHRPHLKRVVARKQAAEGSLFYRKPMQ